MTVLDGTRAHREGGRVLSTGAFTVTVTNEASGESLTFNASGPTFLEGTVIQTGPTLIGQPASRDVGPTFLILNRGRVVYTDNLTIDTRTGKVIDICAELA